MPSKFTSSLIAVVGALLCTAGAQAAFVVTWDFNNDSSTADPTATVTGTDAAKVDAKDFMTAGNAGISGSSDNAFLRAGSTGNDEASALSNTSYFYVTITTFDANDYLDLSTLSLRYGGTSGTVGFTTNLVVQSSVGGFGTGNPTLTVTPNSVVVPSGSTGGGYFENASVDVSGAEFDNLSSITFQFRFFDNATDNSNQINRLDDIQLSGTIVPEPASLALLPLGALALGRRRR